MEAKDEDWECVELERGEAKEYRGLAARFNFSGLDCPDLQFPIKRSSREMAKATKGSWSEMKKSARYLLNRKKIVWKF